MQHSRSYRGASAWIIVVSLLWAGMILGVSGLATPAKFLAPSLTLPVALEVGRHTFALFNWIEVAWAVALVATAFFRRGTCWHYVLTVALCMTVALQTWWLLPSLAVRTDTIIAGAMPTHSMLHEIYIGLEGGKLVVLLLLAYSGLRRLAVD